VLVYYDKKFYYTEVVPLITNRKTSIKHFYGEASDSIVPSQVKYERLRLELVEVLKKKKPVYEVMVCII
jgi:hypothetical protein